MFIVCSKADNLGNQPNYRSLTNYFELGWEVAATHIDAKYLFAIKEITPQTKAKMLPADVATLREKYQGREQTVAAVPA